MCWHTAADSPATLSAARLFQKDSHLSHCIPLPPCFPALAACPKCCLYGAFFPCLPVCPRHFSPISPSLFLHVACTFSAELYFFLLFILHLPPIIPTPPSISESSPSIHPLSSHYLKMLCGPQCFAPFLSAMINSDSVVFCSRLNAASLPRPQLDCSRPIGWARIHAAGCSQWLPGQHRNPSAVQANGHVTLDRRSGRREWYSDAGGKREQTREEESRREQRMKGYSNRRENKRNKETKEVMR